MFFQITFFFFVTMDATSACSLFSILQSLFVCVVVILVLSQQALDGVALKKGSSCTIIFPSLSNQTKTYVMPYAEDEEVPDSDPEVLVGEFED